MGVERLILLLETLELVPDEARPPLDAYVLGMDAAATRSALLLGEELRGALPGLRAQVHCGGGSFKSQIKKADKSGARLALLIGEEELAENAVTVKFLREDREQQRLSRDTLAEVLPALVDRPLGHA
jgi:histidyl-tRNA synthetase